jgi:excinuclease ABC subunit A
VRAPRTPTQWLALEHVSRNNLHDVDVRIPIGAFTAVTGVSGSGKSSLVSQALVDLVCAHLGTAPDVDEEESDAPTVLVTTSGRLAAGAEAIRRLVSVDQKPIGRTPRSNLATYTGLFDHVRKLFANTRAAKARKYDAGRFSFNVAKGRCPTCEGEGFVMVELLFLPSVFAPCPTCHGSATTRRRWRSNARRNIAEVLAMTVDAAVAFFADEPTLHAPLRVLHESGWATCGSASRRPSCPAARRSASSWRPNCSGRNAATPCTCSTSRPPPARRRCRQAARATARVGGFWQHRRRRGARDARGGVRGLGGGCRARAGDEGGRIVATGTPAQVAKARKSRTAPFLAQALRRNFDRASARGLDSES